jgi:hypothetical protein
MLRIRQAECPRYDKVAQVYCFIVAMVTKPWAPRAPLGLWQIIPCIVLTDTDVGVKVKFPYSFIYCDFFIPRLPYLENNETETQSKIHNRVVVVSQLKHQMVFSSKLIFFWVVET